MYIEPNISGAKRGHIEVICGSMFSGKTEELIRRLRRVQIARLRMTVFKPAHDTRDPSPYLVSHDDHVFESLRADSSANIFELGSSSEVVGIDEAQFLDMQLPDICEKLALLGIRVIVAGLDMDYAGKPFGPMPSLLAKADFITKLHAVCVVCGNLAQYSFRKTANTAQFFIGASNEYEPRCRICFNKESVSA